MVEVSEHVNPLEEVMSTDLKLEAVVIPVADVDRSKEFYSGLGWRLDADFAFDNGIRVVQFTRPARPARSSSVPTSHRLTPARRGSAWSSPMSRRRGPRSCRTGQRQRGVPPGGSRGAGRGRRHQRAGDRARGRAVSYRSFATFSDPDGNTWLLQEVTTRLPGRVERGTTYSSVEDLEAALQRAAAAHGEHEARTGQANENWPAWYATYMVAERTGTELPE